jgi:hypothetical protein
MVEIVVFIVLNFKSVFLFDETKLGLEKRLVNGEFVQAVIFCSEIDITDGEQENETWKRKSE